MQRGELCGEPVLASRLLEQSVFCGTGQLHSHSLVPPNTRRDQWYSILKRAVPPYHLAQKLGFLIESGPLQPTPAFVLTECPAATNEGLDSLLLQLNPTQMQLMSILR